MKQYNAGFSHYNLPTPYADTLHIAYWYPTYTSQHTISYLPYMQGKAAPEAEICPTPFPLILISCGYGGTVYDQSYLAEYLSRRGFIVAAVAQPLLEQHAKLGCERAWFRAKEIHWTIDFLLQNLPAIHLAAGIGLIGFSAGGFTAALLSGAQPAFNLDDSFSPFLPVINKLDFQSLIDTRIKTIVLLAPALDHLFPASTLSQIHLPTLLISASHDEIVGQCHNYANFLPNLRHLCLLHAGHYVFNTCTSELMQRVAPRLCADAGIPRRNFHPLIQNTIYQFLKSYSKNHSGVNL
jgi:predicted dienelactone hydrolase